MKSPGMFARTLAVLAASVAASTVAADPVSRMNLSINDAQALTAGPSVDAIKSAVGLSSAVVFSVPQINNLDNAFEVQIPVDGAWLSVELERHSVRSEHYQVLVQGADGKLTPVEPGPINTVRGGVPAIPGSYAAGAWSQDGLEVQVVMPDGASYWVEPARKYLPDAPLTDHFVYRAADVTKPAGLCGVDAPGDHDHGQPPIVDLGTGDCGGMCVAEIACDADVEFFQIFGTVVGVENRINTVINNMSNQYESQCGITFQISTIVVRTAEADPYSSSDGSTLLNQVQNEWISNQPGIPRDLIHLFTGKDITTPGQGNSTIGIASLAVVCTTNGVGAVEHMTPNSCAFDLSAHEIGHNWSANHCCPGTTMNASLTCANTFGAQSINEIVAHRNTRTCLDPELTVVPLPFFDPFAFASLSSTLWSANGASVSTLGDNEPSTPNSCRIRGQQTLTTAPMNTTSTTDLTVSYWWQRGGSGNNPEAGENLIVEYYTNTGTWTQIASHPGGADTAFAFVSFVLTNTNAYHANFRVRFRNPDGETNQDDFFIDDVGIDAMAVAPGAFALLAPANGATGLTQNPLLLDWDNSAAATNYTVTVDDNSDFSSPVVNFGAVIASQLNIAGSPFTEGVTYYWRVRANNTNGQTFGTPNPSTFVIGMAPPPDCPGDVDGSGAVDVDDLNEILGAWNTSVGIGDPRDLANNDGFINVDDLNVILGNWNASCP